MSDAFTKLYLIEEERKSLFRKADVIFDSSALLDIYEYSDSAKEEIVGVFDNISKEKRLWIPHQVEFEYHKNRKKSAKNPISLYQTLIDGNRDGNGMYIKNMTEASKQLSEEYKKAQKALDDILAQTESNDRKKHPYIDASFFDNIKTVSEQLCKSISNYKGEVEKLSAGMVDLLKDRENELQKSCDNDIILNSVNSMFVKGNEYPFERLVKIATEGALRYSHEIPPGYRDAVGNKKKLGIAKYGDLIVWRQLLDYASSGQKDVLLVCNDRKEDWYDNTEHKRPRFELLYEFYCTTRKKIWICTLSEFINDIPDVIKVEKVSDDLLTEAKEQEKHAEETFDLVSPHSGFKSLEEGIFFEKFSAALTANSFVGLRNFVINILGAEGYDYYSSYELINRLEREEKIKFDKIENPYGPYPTTIIIGMG